MSLFSRSLKTRVKWSRDALTASFADASPAMIWRWNRHELPAGFVLRTENGQTHLCQHNAAGAESTLAVFTSAAVAERAIDLLSQNLLGRRSSWRWLVWLLAVIGALLLCAIAYGYLFMHLARPLAPSAVQSRTAAGLGQAVPQARPVAPAAAPAPTAPVPGTPVDVDQIYK
jgi:hypothetical protein